MHLHIVLPLAILILTACDPKRPKQAHTAPKQAEQTQIEPQTAPLPAPTPESQVSPRMSPLPDPRLPPQMAPLTTPEPTKGINEAKAAEIVRIHNALLEDIIRYNENYLRNNDYVKTNEAFRQEILRVNTECRKQLEDVSTPRDKVSIFIMYAGTTPEMFHSIFNVPPIIQNPTKFEAEVTGYTEGLRKVINPHLNRLTQIQPYP